MRDEDKGPYRARLNDPAWTARFHGLYARSLLGELEAWRDRHPWRFVVAFWTGNLVCAVLLSFLWVPLGIGWMVGNLIASYRLLRYTDAVMQGRQWVRQMQASDPGWAREKRRRGR